MNIRKTNHADRDESPQETFDMVSEQYRKAMSMEQDNIPELLDTTILQAAHQAVAKRRLFWLPQLLNWKWMVPLSSVAVLMICLIANKVITHENPRLKEVSQALNTGIIVMPAKPAEKIVSHQDKKHIERLQKRDMNLPEMAEIRESTALTDASIALSMLPSENDKGIGVNQSAVAESVSAPSSTPAVRILADSSRQSKSRAAPLIAKRENVIADNALYNEENFLPHEPMSFSSEAPLRNDIAMAESSFDVSPVPADVSDRNKIEHGSSGAQLRNGTKNEAEKPHGITHPIADQSITRRKDIEQNKESQTVAKRASGDDVHSMSVEEKRVSASNRLSAKISPNSVKQQAKDWLKHISVLKEQGKLKEARESLKKFRSAYPMEIIPPSLKELL